MIFNKAIGNPTCMPLPLPLESRVVEPAGSALPAKLRWGRPTGVKALISPDSQTLESFRVVEYQGLSGGFRRVGRSFRALNLFPGYSRETPISLRRLAGSALRSGDRTGADQIKAHHA
jgi:hypothetical protein